MTILFEILSISIAGSSLALMLPLCWHRSQMVQNASVFLLPFAFDALFMIEIMEVQFSIILAFVGLGLHGVFLVNYFCRLSLPDWISSISKTGGVLILVVGGLFGIMSFESESRLANFLCGASSLMTLFACTTYLLGEL